MIKIKWKVSEQNKIDKKRPFPFAFYENGQHCCRLICKDAYIPDDIKIGNHAEIKIVITDYSGINCEPTILTKRAKTVAEAKKIVSNFIEHNQGLLPEELRDGNM